jgi:hypothetical protein
MKKRDASSKIAATKIVKSNGNVTITAWSLRKSTTVRTTAARTALLVCKKIKFKKKKWPAKLTRSSGR